MAIVVVLISEMPYTQPTDLADTTKHRILHAAARQHNDIIAGKTLADEILDDLADNFELFICIYITEDTDT